jgi:hypothetical protein
MEAYDVHKLGIDVRRFTSFGVIKVDLSRYIFFHYDTNIPLGFSPPGAPLAYTSSR